MRWFKNLKKWQKGGLIGLGIGIILGCFVSPLSHWIPYVYFVSDPILYMNFVFANIVWLIHPGPTSVGGYEDYIMPGAMVIFYGGFGAIVGRVQQVTNTRKRWLLTGLLAFFLLLFYFSSLLTLLSFAMGF